MLHLATDKYSELDTRVIGKRSATSYIQVITQKIIFPTFKHSSAFAVN